MINSNTNVLLNLKYTFLNFIQALFSVDPVYTWYPEVDKTNIIIADRHAVDIGITALRPSILLQRGDVSWAYVTRGQQAPNGINFNERELQSLRPPADISNESDVKAYTDLLRGYIVLNIIDKNGIQAEIIANKVFQALTGFKDELKKISKIQITSLSISQESIMRANSEIELAGVQISLGFTQQIFIIKDETTYNCYVYDGELMLNENHNYKVIENGTQIRLLDSAEDEIKIDYTDAITLESINNVTLIQDPVDPLVYTIPNGGAILGYYKLNTNMLVTAI